MPEETRSQRRRRNGATVLLLVSVVAGMIGMSFASVPLYRVILLGNRLWRHDPACRERADTGRR